MPARSVAQMPVTRKERAAETRRRMMAAACAVFSERGFGGTTMDAVAAEAGVAVQTLYFTFHTKAELLQAAYQYAVFGPEQLPPHLSEWWQQVMDATDVRAAVAALVDGTIPILQRAAPLVWVVRADEDARATYDFNEGLRRDGNAQLIAVLAKKHPLRAGLTRARARDLLLSLTGPQQFQYLIKECGWKVADYRDWVIAALLRELFALDQ
jgi:AcrR family transcriptional regulator